MKRSDRDRGKRPRKRNRGKGNEAAQLTELDAIASKITRIEEELSLLKHVDDPRVKIERANQLIDQLDQVNIEFKLLRAARLN